MGCGTSKRSKTRSQESFSDSYNDSCSKSYSGGIISAQTEKKQLTELNLGETLPGTRSHYCYNCGNKIISSDIFCANCGVKIK